MSSPLHPWPVSVTEALSIQQTLRKQVCLQAFDGPIHYIGGADISFNRGSAIFYAGIVLLDYPSLKVVGHSLVEDKAPFPYVPGLLSFREIPSLLKAWALLPVFPDLMMLDGHGIAHPRRLGLASHFGLWTQKPTIGCAKKLLTGLHECPAAEAKSCRPIYESNEHLGYALRSRTRVKPVYISPGHLINQESALDISLRCITAYRIPEPTRIAHQMVNKLRRGELNSGTVFYEGRSTSAAV